MRGVWQLRVQVNVPDTNEHAEWVEDVDASLLQALTLRGFPIEYTGPDAGGNSGPLPAPGLADFVSTAATTLRRYSVAQTPRQGSV